jgi:PAS domain S-box-containing protein
MESPRQREMEEKLRQSEERYRHLVENALDAVVIQCEGVVVYANSEALRLFGGAAPEQLIGKAVGSMVHPSCKDIFDERLQHPRETGFAAIRREHKLVRLDGISFDVEVAITRIAYLGKSALQIVLRDVTERKRAERRLTEKVNRLEATLEEAKQLEGVVAICMYCKKIKDMNRSWHQLEEYISEHAALFFSHGICPECLEHNLSVMADN